VIVSFGDQATEAVFHGTPIRLLKRIPADVLRRATVKLDYLNGASDLIDLERPPGNRLEALKSDLRGFYSIRVNDQWRIMFRWQGTDAHDVRLTDYHR
jgi:proteic killer suppression protein